MQTLNERVAVVTGADSGIGRALALALAQRGAIVALADVDDAGLGESAACVRAAGRPCSTHRVDVADREAMRALPEAVLAAPCPISAASRRRTSSTSRASSES